MLAYKEYFSETTYQPAIRTRDIDILVPIPHKFKGKVDLESLLKDLDFVINYKGSEGYINFAHPDLMLEFLVPERGRGRETPYPLPEFGANAQPLRYLDLLLQTTLKASFAGVSLVVPHPANFALHKLIVSKLRKNPTKSENDFRQGVDVLRRLVEIEEQQTVKKVASNMPARWLKLVKSALSGTEDEDLIAMMS